MQVAIGIFLFMVGIGALIWGYHTFRRMMSRAAELSVPQPEVPVESIEVRGEVGADGLVYLFGEEFVRAKTAGPATLNRDRAFAPLTGEELNPEDWALQLLHTTLCELHTQSCIECRIVERTPSFLPPFPHKRWELQIVQRTPFPRSPVMDALDVAIDLMRARQQQRVAQGKEEPGELWCPLDEVIERALKAMRQEISFWERSGVYGDVRNYVASALVAQGYLVQPGRETWLNRTRSRRPRPNVEAIEALRGDMEALAGRMRAFRLKHGSPYSRGELEPEEHQMLPDVDPALLTADPDPATAPLEDCLRISIFETLVSLRQLEPSGDAGI